MKKVGLIPVLTVAFLALFLSCTRSLPDSSGRNEILFRTMSYSDPSFNPEPGEEVVDMIRQVIYRLADDSQLERHPVSSYLNDPNMRLTVIFDNPGTVVGAKVVNHNEIHINSQRDFAYYLVTLAHELVHLGIMEKYGNPANFSFLPPEDYAFLNLIEEAFASAMGSWVQLMYPEVPENQEIRSWRFQTDYSNRTEAMRNDFLAVNPDFTLEQAIDEIITELFNAHMTRVGIYTTIEIPRNMAIVYGRRNTHLIPEYEVFRDNSDALLRHVWNYLASMMPFKLPEYFTYDHYRSQFIFNVISWAAAAINPEDSIFFWIYFDADDAAMARLNAAPDSERVYDYLSGEDEERLRRIIQEINFTIADTLAEDS